MWGWCTPAPAWPPSRPWLRPTRWGVIDADYRGELMVSLYNHSNETCTVVCGDRIAQLVIAPYLTAQFQEADELDDTQRGAGGFGSTGVR